MNFAVADLPLPIRVRPGTPMTDDELLRFCSANDDLRIEREPDGELVVMSPTGSETGGRNIEIATDLANWARRDGRGKVFGSTSGFTLRDGSMRAADASWIAYVRWNALTREEQRRFAPICPDFIIELRSPTDSLPELQAKMEQWIANGAQLAWLIDPSRKSVSIYRPGRGMEILEGAESVAGEGPVEGLVLPLTEIWK